jgi:hypothetical protein
MLGLFTELGPFFVASDETSVIKNPYSWHKNHSIIFIDNPVGTGMLMKWHKLLSTNSFYIYIHSHMFKFHDCAIRKPKYLNHVSGSVWSTKLNCTKWKIIFYASHSDYTDLEVDITPCVFRITPSEVQCSRQYFLTAVSNGTVNCR